MQYLARKKKPAAHGTRMDPSDGRGGGRSDGPGVGATIEGDTVHAAAFGWAPLSNSDSLSDR